MNVCRNTTDVLIYFSFGVFLKQHLNDVSLYYMYKLF